ncbi:MULTISPECIES: PhaM family polyhydroxyalkanoate granule multifunctional regulatory protein [unclassified Acidovorax]|uniref:PhaM family polyhydroxyalkanoate granule multifunctional regulatory protein n=1 Tax=unclassified Acidovorax TaxID=2684926 RepID=UPI002882E768|nr:MULTISPECIES: PhaM family polyhydroxyalkanoate granule multifunctional regulatory protein [unclassified Acidovorax]
MSDNSPFGFGRFVPGFDFLQNLAKNSTAGVPAMPGMSSWVAPTVNEEELEKRIEELKAVQFWLDQNSRALTATVQALEVQKMTLATLKGMNVAMGDLANAFTPKPQAAADAPAASATSASSFFTAAPPASRAAAPEPGPAPDDQDDHGSDEDPNAGPADEAGAGASSAAGAAAGVVDPMQWWTALSTQFQQIATHALKDVAQHQSALDATRDMAAEAVKTATGVASQLAAQGLQGVQDVTRKTASAAAPKKPSAAKAPAKKAAPKVAAKTAAKKSAAKTPAKAAAKTPAKKPTPSRAARTRPAR